MDFEQLKNNLTRKYKATDIFIDDDNHNLQFDLPCATADTTKEIENDVNRLKLEALERKKKKDEKR